MVLSILKSMVVITFLLLTFNKCYAIEFQMNSGGYNKFPVNFCIEGDYTGRDVTPGFKISIEDGLSTQKNGVIARISKAYGKLTNLLDGQDLEVTFGPSSSTTSFSGYGYTVLKGNRTGIIDGSTSVINRSVNTSKYYHNICITEIIIDSATSFGRGYRSFQVTVGNSIGNRSSDWNNKIFPVSVFIRDASCTFKNSQDIDFGTMQVGDSMEKPLNLELICTYNPVNPKSYTNSIKSTANWMYTISSRSNTHGAVVKLSDEKGELNENEYYTILDDNNYFNNGKLKVTVYIPQQATGGEFIVPINIVLRYN